MDRLWAPWRQVYLADPKKSEGCILCDYPKRDDAREALVLTSDETTFVILNRYPYNNAHLMVVPRIHTGDYSTLAAATRAALAEVVERSIRVIAAAYKPDGFNVGMNLGAAGGAGIAGHLHWHVVPRWNGDTNFMSTCADAKVMGEHLFATYDKLRPGFAA
ncbi:MAG: HIT domain-containing protein [Deltaproteobacteria bacterium]|nr:HIT domain-containing protein [Deltaproteobacteria bacterium]